MAAAYRRRRMDENGYVQVTGRIKDMVIRGGEHLSARDRRASILTQHIDAQVIGVPDERYGEELGSDPATQRRTKTYCRSIA